MYVVPPLNHVFCRFRLGFMYVVPPFLLFVSMVFGRPLGRPLGRPFVFLASNIQPSFFIHLISFFVNGIVMNVFINARLK